MRSSALSTERGSRDVGSDCWRLGDANDLYFHLGYVSAFRIFETVRVLASWR
jgi:hypothetical protein